MEVKYFFDSYAIIELIKGNLNYAKYVDCIMLTSLLNLIEVYWAILINFDEYKAEEEYKKLKDCVVSINDEVIFEAMKFRMKNKKNDLSYADCIGYMLAKKNSVKFLTGDKEFKYLDNVEFVQS